MKFLSCLIAFAAIVGLLGQEAALARTMPFETSTQAESAMQMGSGCTEMGTVVKKASQSQVPCQGMTLDCIAKMGCAIPLALVPPFHLDVSPQFRRVNPPFTPVALLVGRDISPEPEPPSRLG